jgi:hypothetical protein
VTTYRLEIARILGNPNEYEKGKTERSRLEARGRRYDDTAASRQGVFSGEAGEAGDGESLLDVLVATGAPGG